MNYLWQYCKRYYHFWYWVLRQFFRDGCAEKASALTYSSLLALVPFMIVIVSALSLFPFFAQTSHVIQNFIFENFVPHTGSQIQAIVLDIEQQVGKLPAIGFGFLFVTAIILMFNIDQALNTIFYSPEKRRVQSSFLMYWALLTIGPVLLGASLGLSSYIQSLQLFEGLTQVSHLSEMLMSLPFMLSVLGFTFIYWVVPHGSINLLHAFFGGLFSAILFEVAKFGFGYYVVAFPTYTLLYGALATIPLFLLWVYISWVIFLLGAEMINGLSYQQAYRSRHTMPKLAIAYVTLKEVWQAQERHEGLSFSELIKNGLPLCDLNQVRYVLEVMVAKGLLMRNKRDVYTLLCDCHELSLKELQQVLEWSVAPENLKHLPDHQGFIKELIRGLKLKRVPTLYQLFLQHSSNSK